VCVNDRLSLAVRFTTDIPLYRKMADIRPFYLYISDIVHFIAEIKTKYFYLNSTRNGQLKNKRVCVCVCVYFKHQHFSTGAESD
jgi:hypothetical protein